MNESQFRTNKSLLNDFSEKVRITRQYLEFIEQAVFELNQELNKLRDETK